jgi:hypothetical protein
MANQASLLIQISYQAVTEEHRLCQREVRRFEEKVRGAIRLGKREEEAVA